MPFRPNAAWSIQLGQFNSSITRVWPIFDTLLSRDPTGSEWFNRLLALAPTTYSSKVGTLLSEVGQFDKPIPRSMRRDLSADQCRALGNLRQAFEAEVAPPIAFLEWMLRHPDRLKWPLIKGERRRFSESTQANREALLRGDANAQQEALSALIERGAAGCARQWWAFEGFTSVDCRLETESLILFIEGKRKEGISSAIGWYPDRNQLVRNLEAAADEAKRIGKDYAVLLCAERSRQLSEADFIKSLPHLSEQQRQRLWAHFLGCVTWSELRQTLCPDLALPDTVDEAVPLCAALRQAIL
jgi:hypothetical protein